ncbi:hypothetical protein ES703_72879 [subsurface metagenome]
MPGMMPVRTPAPVPAHRAFAFARRLSGSGLSTFCLGRLLLWTALSRSTLTPKSPLSKGMSATSPFTKFVSNVNRPSKPESKKIVAAHRMPERERSSAIITTITASSSQCIWGWMNL